MELDRDSTKNCKRAGGNHALKLTHMEFGCQPSRHHGEEAFPKLRHEPCRARALGEYFMTLYDSGRAPTHGVRVRVRVRVRVHHVRVHPVP